MKRKQISQTIVLLVVLCVCLFISACAHRTPTYHRENQLVPQVTLESNETIVAQKEVPPQPKKVELTEEEKIIISINQRAQELIDSDAVSKVQVMKIPSDRYAGIIVNEDRYITYDVIIFGPSPYFSNAYKYEVIPQTIIYLELPPGFYHWRSFTKDKKMVGTGELSVGLKIKTFENKHAYLNAGYRELDDRGYEIGEKYSGTTIDGAEIDGGEVVHFGIDKLQTIFEPTPEVGYGGTSGSFTSSGDFQKLSQALIQACHNNVYQGQYDYTINDHKKLINNVEVLRTGLSEVIKTKTTTLNKLLQLCTNSNVIVLLNNDEKSKAIVASYMQSAKQHDNFQVLSQTLKLCCKQNVYQGQYDYAINDHRKLIYNAEVLRAGLAQIVNAFGVTKSGLIDLCSDNAVKVLLQKDVPSQKIIQLKLSEKERVNE